MNTKYKIIIGASALLAGGLAYWYFFRKDKGAEADIDKREAITITKN